MIIIDRPEVWKRNRHVPVKPYRVGKGRSWDVLSRTVTVYDKKNRAILSLSEGEWTRVRRG